MNDPNPKAAIEVRDLVTEYGGRRILDGIDLEVARGEIMVIIGGSGAGKSTLLAHLLGLESPRHGTIRILGKDLAGLSKSRRQDLIARFEHKVSDHLPLWLRMPLP